MNRWESFSPAWQDEHRGAENPHCRSVISIQTVPSFLPVSKWSLGHKGEERGQACSWESVPLKSTAQLMDEKITGLQGVSSRLL